VITWPCDLLRQSSVVHGAPGHRECDNYPLVMDTIVRVLVITCTVKVVVRLV
jgi:hypothetical protein